MELQTVIHSVPYLQEWLSDNHRMCETYHYFWAWQKQSLLRTAFQTYRSNAMRYRWFRTKVLPAIVQAQSHYVCLHLKELHEQAENYYDQEPVLYPVRHKRTLMAQDRAIIFDCIDRWYYPTNCMPPIFRYTFWTDPVGLRPDTSLVYHPYIQSWLTDWWSMPMPSRIPAPMPTIEQQAAHATHERNSRPSWLLPSFPELPRLQQAHANPTDPPMVGQRQNAIQHYMERTIQRRQQTAASSSTTHTSQLPINNDPN